jgi:hypothetical protein
VPWPQVRPFKSPSNYVKTSKQASSICALDLHLYRFDPVLATMKSTEATLDLLSSLLVSGRQRLPCNCQQTGQFIDEICGQRATRMRV